LLFQVLSRANPFERPGTFKSVSSIYVLPVAKPIGCPAAAAAAAAAAQDGHDPVSEPALGGAQVDVGTKHSSANGATLPQRMAVGGGKGVHAQF